MCPIVWHSKNVAYKIAFKTFIFIVSFLFFTFFATVCYAIGYIYDLSFTHMYILFMWRENTVELWKKLILRHDSFSI